MKLKLRSELNIPPESLVLTFIGTFGPWHGVPILAQAITDLIDQPTFIENNHICFLLVGNGSEMFKVQSILNHPRYRRHVIFTDTIPQEKAPDYLAISDICLSPQVSNPDGSRFFGSPTKLFEYMSMEKPIIASDLEQIGQVLKNSLSAVHLPVNPPLANASELGVLCEPGNVDHLVNAIKFICENISWRRLLGINARKEVLKKYTWDINVQLFLNKLIY